MKKEFFTLLFACSSLSSDTTQPILKHPTLHPLCKHVAVHKQEIEVAAFSSDFSMLLTADREEIQIRSWPALNRLHTIKGLGRIRPVAFSKDKRFLAIGSFAGKVTIIELPTFKSYMEVEGFPEWVQSLQFSPDSRILAAGAFGNELRIIDVPGKTVKKKLSLSQPVSELAFLPSGKSLVVGYAHHEQSIQIISLNDFKIQQVVGDLEDGAHSLSLNLSGDLLAAGSRNSPHRIWSLDGKSFTNSIYIYGEVPSLKISETDKVIWMTNYLDNAPKLLKWHYVTDKLEEVIPDLGFYPGNLATTKNSVLLTGFLSNNAFVCNIPKQ